MVTRQRVILLLMVAVILYGVYNFFFSRPETTVVKSSMKRLEELKTFVVDAATNLSREYVSAADRYIIQQAEKAWPRNPFLQTGELLKSKPVEARAGVSIETVQLAYTGFLQISDRFLAIVNGMEYEVGEQLAEVGYFVENITPAAVVIRSESSPKKIVLALDEATDVVLKSAAAGALEGN